LGSKSPGGPGYRRFDRQTVQSACMPTERFPRRVFSAKFFRNSVSFNVAEACVYSGHPTRSHAPEGFRRRNCLVEKPHPAARQIRANRVAFSLPQDSSLQLILEACVKRGSELSAFHDVGFHADDALVILNVVVECVASD
jgi:hypothetical protein